MKHKVGKKYRKMPFIYMHMYVKMIWISWASMPTFYILIYQIFFSLGHEKRKSCFTGTTDPNFLFGRKLLFSIFSKIFWNQPFFDQDLKILAEFFLKISLNIFPKFFCKNIKVFSKFIVFLGSCCGIIIKKKYLKKKLPNRSTLLGRSVRP